MRLIAQWIGTDPLDVRMPESIAVARGTLLGGTDRLVDCEFFYRSLHHVIPGPLQAVIARLQCCKPQVAARQRISHEHLRQGIVTRNVGARFSLRLRRAAPAL